MTILAKNEKGEELTFNTMEELNLANKWKFRGYWEIIDADYNPKSESFEDLQIEEIEKEISNEISEELDEIEIEEIKVNQELKKVIHKDELTQYTFASFKENIKEFTKEDLETFIKFDERKSIVNEAKREIKRRK